MTTYPFVQPNNSVFQFQATFDSSLYTVYLTWNVFAQRYYVNIYDLSNTLIVCLPRISSPPTSGAQTSGQDISMTAGYFTSTLTWRDETQMFEVLP